jgi:hypothetical protein
MMLVPLRSAGLDVVSVYVAAMVCRTEVTFKPGIVWKSIESGDDQENCET